MSPRHYCTCGAAFPDKVIADFLAQRDIDVPCTKCHGYGRRMYGSTSTWRGGMGGQMMTTDVCDHCWGTGDEQHHGANLRAMRDSENQRIAERALTLLADACGANMDSCRPAIAVIIETLTKLSNKRGAPAAAWLPELSQALANTLRRAIGVAEVRKWR